MAFAAQQSDTAGEITSAIAVYLQTNKGQKLSTGFQVTVAGIQPF
jgi:hypothetical protein